MAAKKRRGAARKSANRPVKKAIARGKKAPVRAAKASKVSPRTRSLHRAIDGLFDAWHAAARRSGQPVSALEVARHKKFWKDALSRLESMFEPVSGLR